MGNCEKGKLRGTLEQCPRKGNTGKDGEEQRRQQDRRGKIKGKLMTKETMTQVKRQEISNSKRG